VPLDRLLLETDAPWCEIRPTHASHQFLGKALPAGIVPRWPDTCRAEAFVEGAMVKSRNEPCGMVRVFEVMYALRRDEVKSPEELAEIVWANTCRLFRVDFAAPAGAVTAAPAAASH
jgi:TatD DNase family protein